MIRYHAIEICGVVKFQTRLDELIVYGIIYNGLELVIRIYILHIDR